MLISIYESVSNFFTATWRTFVRFYLIGLILASLALAISIFTATQFQVRVANYSLGGAPLSVWKVNKLVEQWRIRRGVAEKELEAAQKIEESASRDLEEASATLKDTAAQIATLSAALQGAKHEVAESIRQTNVSLADKVEAAKPEEAQALIAPLRRTRNPPDETVSKFEEARKNYLEALAREEKAESAEARAKDALQSLQNQMESAQKVALLPLKEDDLKDGAQVEIAMYEFEEMSQLRWGKWIHTLALLPTDFLTLALVVVMGLLGSSLQLSYIYTMQDEQRSISFYLTRPFLGVITAFVVYIVVKAGIPLVADPARLGGSVPVNPYFISFVAIISGLLSERAIMSLINIGSSYFRVDPTGQPQRWATTDLRPLFAEAKRDVKSIGRILQRDDAQIEKWISGQEALPYNAQTLVAAILNRSPRELFTDIPPDASAPPAVGESNAAEESEESEEPEETAGSQDEPESQEEVVPEEEDQENKAALTTYLGSGPEAKVELEAWLKERGVEKPVAFFIQDPLLAALRRRAVKELITA